MTHIPWYTVRRCPVNFPSREEFHGHRFGGPRRGESPRPSHCFDQLVSHDRLSTSLYTLHVNDHCNIAVHILVAVTRTGNAIYNTLPSEKTTKPGLRDNFEPTLFFDAEQVKNALCHVLEKDDCDVGRRLDRFAINATLATNFRILYPAEYDYLK